MYRMKTRNTQSVVNDATIAFWTTTNTDIIPNAPNTTAAPSVQFGIPLWYFDHDEVHAISDAIFTEWKLPIYE
jgi:hypothetical protein